MLLSLSLFLSALVQTGPFNQLEGAYPWGDQLCSEPTPDNKLLFVAPGAGISILNVETLPAVTQPTVIAHVEVPECAPLSMRFFEMMDNGMPPAPIRRLFMAGGTMGLWELTLCPSLFTSPPVDCGSYNPTIIDRIGGAQLWLRCIDVDVVTGNAAGTPLLFALFASRADSTTAGPTQLHAYRLNTNGSITSYASFPFPAAPPVPANYAAGRALAVDPADPSHIYVAMGRGGLYQVDISTSTFSATAMNVPACPLTACPTCPPIPCELGEEVRDVDIISTTSFGSVLYAALEYGRLAEYRLVSGPGVTPAVIPLVCQSGCTTSGVEPCSVIERVTARQTYDGRVLIFAGAEGWASRTADTRAPYRTTGIWADHCIRPGVLDPNGVPYNPHFTCRQVFVLRRNLATFQTETFAPHPYGEYWGTLRLMPWTGDAFRLYETTNFNATSVREVTFGFMQNGRAAAGGLPSYDAPKVTLVATHVDWAFPAADCDVSSLNPAMAFFAFDGFGLTDLTTTMLYIDSSTTPLDLKPVPNTLGLCGSSRPVVFGPIGEVCGDPNPYYSSSVFGCAHWPDPADPTHREIFFAGGKSVQRVVPGQCGTIDPVQCGDPCAMNPRPYWWQQRFNPTGILEDPSTVGWRYQSMDVSVWPPPPTNPSVRWFQLPAPTNFDGDKNDDVDYVTSELHPGGQDLVIATRSGSKHGLKGYMPTELDTLTQTSCLPGPGGNGERLPQVGWPTFFEALTHIEREDPGTGNPLDVCAIGVPCQFHGTNRNLFNTRSKTFSCTYLGATKWITVVAAGTVATIPQAQGQTAFCRWSEYGGKGELVVYDITNSAGPTFASPQLLRVALGPLPIGMNDATPGLFWGVDVKTYPPQSEGGEAKCYAFVADLFGRVQVFDVSPSQLFPAVTLPYLLYVPPPATPPPPSAPILTPITAATVLFKSEPADGLAPNCVDLEIDGNYAYVALAKGGVAVIDIHADPGITPPQIVDVIDTPGIAFGVAFRRVAGVATHLLVSDSRCGVRLYRR